MHRMSVTRFWWVPVLLLCTTGCVFRFGQWGESSSNGISVRDGTVTMDGVKLPYDRWVDVAAELGDSTDASISTATGEITLRGTPGTGVSLQAHLHSEYEKDGSARFDDGELQAVDGQGKTYINAVRGTIPEDVSVNLVTGTGAIQLDDMRGERTLKLASGTGPISLGSSAARVVDVSMGTAEIRISDTQADRMEIETGTGDLNVNGGGANALEVESGTGEITLTGARFETVVVDGGTGDVVLDGCEIGRVEVDSGTGDLILRGGRCEHVELDSGTGKLRIRDGAVIGVGRD